MKDQNIKVMNVAKTFVQSYRRYQFVGYNIYEETK